MRQWCQPKGESSLVISSEKRVSKLPNEVLVSCQKFKLANERACTTKDARLAAGFEGHLGNLVCQRKIMADGEAQKFEWPHLFKCFV